MDTTREYDYRDDVTVWVTAYDVHTDKLATIEFTKDELIEMLYSMVENAKED